MTATKGERTRARLTAATAALLQKQGYHATGLAEVLLARAAAAGAELDAASANAAPSQA